MNVHPAAELFPLLEDEQLDGIVRSIREHGFDTGKPILRYRGAVLDGRNRLRACELAGVAPVFSDAPDDCDPWMESWKHNGARRDLEASQKGMIFIRIKARSQEWRAEQEARREAADRARSASQKGTPKVDKERAPSRDGARSATAKELAEEAGVSTRTIERVQKVQREAPEKVDAIVRGEMSAPEALKIVKLEKKQDLAEELRAKPLPPPTDGPFGVIVLDPPWQYEKRSEDITHRGRNPYPDMTVEEICDPGRVPLVKLAEPDCILWLWTTNAFMRDAYRCLDAWGFREKTILTWVKDRMGTGDWLRGKTEHCILAVRGKPLVTLTNQTTELRAPLREHSRKPDEFYAMVDALCPGTKLDMFAREGRPGWAVWGAETEKYDGK